MGQVIRLMDFQPGASKLQKAGLDSLIPLELALGESDQHICLTTVVRHGTCGLYPKPRVAESGTVEFLVRVSDAISLNKSILDSGELDETQTAVRMDLIQMLENVSGTFLDGIWGTSSNYNQINAVPGG